MLLATFLLAATTTPLGTVLTSDHANVGNAAADVGTTVYSGDKLSTGEKGSIQIRAGSARLALLQGSTAELGDGPSAKLVLGTVQFSTLKADALTLTVLNAIVRANTDSTTIGQVIYAGKNEMTVTAKRGSLLVKVGADEQVVDEGKSYRVLLDDPQGPTGAGGGPPAKAGRSRFLLVSTILIGGATAWAIHEAYESPKRP